MIWRMIKKSILMLAVFRLILLWKFCPNL
ncbi:hypothetical protein Pint_08559 [Pistacia integerrima]|uniref:Uncharacterized protein n=1 Tax=Pistacia integerrima TaxID=434235 RepID=A0ACC0XWN0_9ROSI|nr:hypothetical protein Pint_08559 [Pistacia integerrima]